MKTKSSKITEGSARKLCFILAVICIFLGISELAEAQGPPTLFWDGPNLTPGMVEGGNGVWNSNGLGNANWCDINGNNNTQWVSGAHAVFETIGGTVTADTSLGNAIFIGDLRFEVNGYQIVAATGTQSRLQVPDLTTITTDAGVTATISAPLADVENPGRITKEGPGTLVLSGANTYTGITTINAGVLSISSDGNLGTAPGTRVADQLTFNGGTLQVTASFTLNPNRGITLLAGGGTIEVTGANTLSYAGSISGTGNLTKIGTGTQILGGRNSYTGTTFVNDGTLTLESLDQTPPNPRVINGPLIIGDDVGAPNTATVIDTDVGAPPKILTSVPVTVNSDGLFRVDFGDPVRGIGEGVGPLVINRGNVRVEGSLLPDHLEMNGGLIFGGGTLVLPDVTATSDASGTPAIISANAKLPGASRVLTVNDGPGSTNLLISGVIFSDPGQVVGITKEGTGTLVLSGANTYTGPTIVNAGTLLVDGSLASAQTFVNAGGLLGGGPAIAAPGRGIIGGSLLNGGIVNPGNSPGTLTVAGNYTQTAGGTLQIEIAGTTRGQFDLLAVGGHASLAGTLQLIPLRNFQLQAGDKLTFLTAQGGVSGTFSTIQNPFLSNTLIKAEINILGNAVELEGVQGSITEGACNPNTLAVAKALDSTVGDPRMAEVIRFLDSVPLSEICGDLELIAPDEVASIFNMGVSLANVQTANLSRRMDDIRAGSTGFSAAGFAINTRGHDFGMGFAGPTGPEGKSGPSVMQPTPQNRWGVFVTGLGEFTGVDDTSKVPGYNFSTGGLTFGVDYRVSPNFAIGLTGGYAHTNTDLVNNGSLDVNGGTIGAYATGFVGGFYADAAALGVFNGYDTHRTALLGTASGETDGRDFNALVEAGYDWKRGGLTIGPLASFQYTYVEFDSFTEHGSLTPLSFSDQNAHSSRTALGAKASYDWHAGHVLIRPEIRASWQHEFGDRDYSLVSRFANGAGNSFTVHGPAIGRDSLLLGAGAAVLFNDRVSVYAYYDGELGRSNYSSNNVSAGVRVTF